MLLICVHGFSSAEMSLEKISNSKNHTIKITKSIRSGDLERFQSIIDEVKNKKFILHMNAIQLDVHGGDPGVARSIGQVIRKNKLNTFLAPNADCVSACIYLAISGVRRMIYGNVLVHRLALVKDDLSSEKIEMAIREHKQENSEYIIEMGGSVLLIEAINFTPNWALRRLTTDEIKHWGIFGSEHIEDEILVRKSAKQAELSTLKFNEAYVENLDVCKKQEYSFKELAIICTIREVERKKIKWIAKRFCQKSFQQLFTIDLYLTAFFG